MTWEASLGAVVTPTGGVCFRVWAPAHRELILILERSGHTPLEVALVRDGEYWQATVPTARAGDRYRYRVDSDGPFPDPCSRSQPEGVHGPSEVIDQRAFEWSDSAFTPPPREDLVIYECHVGTFTSEGTFEAVIERLSYLVELGVTALELMPVASFPGTRNWGYDGVALFAPMATYGGPDGLRRFVDAAHASGLAIILDVVYNHFGPDGNYTGAYSSRYLTDRHCTPWGAAVNFDGAGSPEVRRFVVENLLHWAHEYHVDGFRLDAANAIIDSSPYHALAEVRTALHAHPRAGHAPYLIAETDENEVRYLGPTSEGGFGFDAVWADDFHHVVRNLFHENREGYLGGFEGTTAELARTISQGFLYEGEFDPYPGRARGTPAREQPWRQFLYCLQNHDQVGNRALGDRLSQTAGRDDILAATMLLLLLPQTPLIFQGQEFLASTPFLYFTDHADEMGRMVTEGRRQEFAAFTAFTDPATRDRIPDPQAESTFLQSKVNWRETETVPGSATLRYHSELLRLRKNDAVLCDARRGRPAIVAAADDRALFAQIETPAGWRAIALNAGDSPTTFEAPRARTVVVHTGEDRFGAAGSTPLLRAGRIEIPPHSAAFLSG